MNDVVSAIKALNARMRVLDAAYLVESDSLRRAAIMRESAALQRAVVSLYRRAVRHAS